MHRRIRSLFVCLAAAACVVVAGALGGPLLSAGAATSGSSGASPAAAEPRAVTSPDPSAATAPEARPDGTAPAGDRGDCPEDSDAAPSTSGTSNAT